jgi:dTDP-4-amino-4,6-dideoxygalactose transaminase
MTQDFISLSYNHLDKDNFDSAYTFFEQEVDVLDQFENSLNQFTGSNTLALNTGTSAIHLALKVLGIVAGDEVICPSFTFIATVNPICYQNAIPVFVDSEEDTWNMSPVLLEEAIIDRIDKTGRPPKAVLLTHIYGVPAKLIEIGEICNRYNIALIEDAAEALGANLNNQAVGTFGKLGIYSFNNNKIVTSFGGGVLIGDDVNNINQAKYLATQAKSNTAHYQHEEVGYNYRMGLVNAAFGLDCMDRLQSNIKRRREIRSRYFEELGDLGSFQNEIPTAICNGWLSTIQFNNVDGYNEVYEVLKHNNIESRPLWKPMHLQPIFKEYPYYGDGLSERLFEKGLCLPSGSNMTAKEQERVIDTIKKCFD